MNRKCKFCKYLSPVPPAWMGVGSSGFECRAKDKIPLVFIPRWFCQCFEVKQE